MSAPAGKGLILAAPTSGSGKTTLTLGLLRALNDITPTRGAKSGPDYIDPKFHEAASGQPSLNLDAWAMAPEQIKALTGGSDFLLIEGAMGLFDGAPPDGKGATADLARILDLPVILVVDAARMSHSIAPLVAGFAQHDPGVEIAAVLLNNVGSPRHEAMLRRALAPLARPVIGAIPRNPQLALPSRHLGLVQAIEHPDLEHFVETVATSIRANVDLDAILALARSLPQAPGVTPPKAPRTIAVAQDEAFAFTYPHLLRQWTEAGATVKTFSPLADEAVPAADWIYLPGGYPELHAARLSASDTFLTSLRNAAQDIEIYGECGGYMTLGESLTDAEGRSHTMAGLLPLDTSFAKRKLHLGYRLLTAHATGLAGTHGAHEFHSATTLRADGPPLFEARDAEGTSLEPMGLVQGNVSGSFAHIIAAR